MKIRPIRRGFHTSGFDRDSLAISNPDATRLSEQGAERPSRIVRTRLRQSDAGERVGER